ncbi:MAG: CBS domain-containing protein [Acidimicrobiia bacterium]|nr:CBS domain-containing protein [Acidimicrobiia bacterium]
MNLSELVPGPPISCSPTTTAKAAARLMEAEHVGSIAVIDDDQFVGLVTDRDMVQLVANATDANVPVSTFMTQQPDTVDIDTEVEDAADWLNATGYRHLPVTRNGKLIGMISIKDLLWAIAGQ